MQIMSHTVPFSQKKDNMQLIMAFAFQLQVPFAQGCGVHLLSPPAVLETQHSKREPLCSRSSLMPLYGLVYIFSNALDVFHLERRYYLTGKK